MKIQIPHDPATHGETGPDLWLTTDPLGRVAVGVGGGDVAKVDIDALISALEAINTAEDHPMDHPARKPLGLLADTEEGNPAT